MFTRKRLPFRLRPSRDGVGELDIVHAPQRLPEMLHAAMDTQIEIEQQQRAGNQALPPARYNPQKSASLFANYSFVSTAAQEEL